MNTQCFHRKSGNTYPKKQSEQPPIAFVVAQACFPSEGSAIHGEKTTDDECDTEGVHRQLIDQIVAAVVKVVWSVVSNCQQRRADSENNEPAEEQQMKQSA